MISEFAGIKPILPDSVFVAPTAVIIGNVTAGEEASIWFQTVARGDINSIHIGNQTNIQDSCVLHVTGKHPLVIGNRVTAGHGAILHGCKINDYCLIAMGAIVLDDAEIGEHCVVGAGALVPPGMKIPAGSLVLGSPAKIIRPVNDADLEMIESGWRHYVENARAYQAQLGSKLLNH